MITRTALAGPTLSSEEYVERVLREAPGARIIEADAAVARADALGTGLWPNPSVGWDREQVDFGGGARETQDIAAISIPLVFSGRLGLERQAAKARAEAAEARRLRARAELRHTAARRFTAALAAQARRGVLEDALGATDELSRIIAARERAGDAAGYDRMRIELERAVVVSALEGARVDAHQARREATRLLGADTLLPELTGPIVDGDGIPDLTAALAALETRADFRALDLEIASGAFARRAAGRAWLPDPTVSAGAKLLDTDREDGVGYVVGLSFPLPFSERGQGARARAEAQRELAVARRAALAQATRAAVVAAYDDAAARRERLARHCDAVLPQSDQLLNTVRQAYRLGGAELLALVDAERTARDARLMAVDLERALADVEADLRLVTGAYEAGDDLSDATRPTPCDSRAAAGGKGR